MARNSVSYSWPASARREAVGITATPRVAAAGELDEAAQDGAVLAAAPRRRRSG